MNFREMNEEYRKMLAGEVYSAIDLMFELYSRKMIRRVWKERMAIQGDYLMRLNVMIAMYYFGIKQPERYLARVEREHIKKISKDAANVYRTL